MKNKTSFSILIAAALFLVFSGAGLSWAATLTVGNNSALPGAKNVIIPVSLASEGGENVSGLNIDIIYKTCCLVFKGVTVGQAALDAQKSVSFSTPQPGTIRIIVFGLNQNIIADGIIANVSFNILSSSSSGKKPLNLTNYVATDPKALSVPLKIVAGAILINNGAEYPILVVKVKQMKGFLIWRLYKLEIEGDIQPVSWHLAGKQKLPFGMGLDKKKGIISGIALAKGKFDLKLEVIAKDGKKLEATCRLEVK